MQITEKNINNNNNVSNFICSNWVIALRACLAQATRCVEAWGVAKHEVKVLKTKTKWWKSQIKRGQNGAQNGVSCRKNKRWNDWWLRWTRKNKPSARNVNKTEPCKGSRSIPLSLFCYLFFSLTFCSLYVVHHGIFILTFLFDVSDLIEYMTLAWTEKSNKHCSSVCVSVSWNTI